MVLFFVNQRVFFFFYKRASYLLMLPTPSHSTLHFYCDKGAKPNSNPLGLDPESIPGLAGDGGRDPDLRRPDDYMLICKKCK